MTLTQLAKAAVETYLKTGKIIEIPKDLSLKYQQQKAGTFVTIENKGKLRGCIGTYLPTRDNLAEEIIYNAIAAATEDYRFEPITLEELPHLTYTVYVLNPPELVKDIKELDPKKFGVIVRTRPLSPSQEINVFFNGIVPPKTGLLLPDLPEVDTVEKQLLIACQKGNINPNKEKIFIYKFTVEKFYDYQ